MASGVPLQRLVWSEWIINRSWDLGSLLVVVVLAVASVVALRGLRWAWWTPRRLERVLRQQGIGGNPYQLLVGDMRDSMRLNKEASSRPMPAFSHDIAPRVHPLLHQSMAKHGKICCTWFGPYPRVIVNNLDMIRDIISTKFDHFEKSKLNPLAELLVTGLFAYEGDKWAKHRRIINPAFHVEKLKHFLLVVLSSLLDGRNWLVQMDLVSWMCGQSFKILLEMSYLELHLEVVLRKGGEYSNFKLSKRGF